MAASTVWYKLSPIMLPEVQNPSQRPGGKVQRGQRASDSSLPVHPITRRPPWIPLWCIS